jgi:hypothetical protein
MSFSYSPKIVTDGLCFYLDTLNPKCRDRSFSASAGTASELIKGGEFTLENGLSISSDYKSIKVDGTDDHMKFTSGVRRQPFVNYKPSDFTFSAWIKSGTTGPGGVAMFAGSRDYTLDYTPLTGTSYSQGIYSNIPGTNVTNGARTVPNFTITIDSGGTVTSVKALSQPHNSLSGDTILILGSDLGGTSPVDDAYFRYRVAGSSNSRWGMTLGTNFSAFLSNNETKGVYSISRADNEPNEWNLVTYTDEGKLLTEGNRKWYINGELVKSSLSADTPWLNSSWMDNPSTGLLFIGRGGSSFSDTINGQVASIMMYDRAINADEVLRNYNAIKERFK